MQVYWCREKECPKVAPLFSSDATYGRVLVVCRWCDTRQTVYLGGYVRRPQCSGQMRPLLAADDTAGGRVANGEVPPQRPVSPSPISV